MAEAERRDRETTSTPSEVEKTVVRGRSAGAPFVLLGGVALAIWVVVGVVAAALLLLWWLT